MTPAEKFKLDAVRIANGETVELPKESLTNVPPPRPRPVVADGTPAWTKEGGATMQMDLSNLLFKQRPDLWAISRVLRHCRGDVPTGALRQVCWDQLSPEDQDILRSINEGKRPESLDTQGRIT